MRTWVLIGLLGVVAWMLWSLIQADTCGERWLGSGYQSRWTLRGGCQVSRDGFTWNRAPEVTR